MKTSANAEQVKAIEHFGGVLLSAGAGSGKTFVLTEHLLFLTKTWIDEYESNPLEGFDSFIKAKYSQLVMMTFTNKAAGEILIRIKKNFAQAAEENDNPFWRVASDQIESVTISTIHGFCMKLMQMGLLTNVPSQIEIISDVEFDILISNIADKWFLNKINENNLKVEFLLRVKSEMIDSLKRIISDPILRTKWTEAQIYIDDKIQLNSIIEEIYGLNNFNEIFEDAGSIQSLLGGYKKPWEEELTNFFSLAEKSNPDFESFLNLCNYFEDKNFKIAVTPRAKNIDVGIINYYKKFKLLKDYIKENHESFMAFSDHKGIVQEWYNIIFDLIHYTSLEYSKQGKLTFGDLEYLTYQSLKNEQTASLVSKEFSYIIVDEFQDTSSMQFEIISKIVPDQSKLFCVGDLKQAIYGFRGGELEVFQNLERVIPLNLSLNNNYRSKEAIISFNNSIFSYLFTKSFGYEGVDPFQVEVQKQLSPIDTKDKGTVAKLIPDLSFLDDSVKLTNSDLDYLEALSITEQIKKIDDGNIAVLYKKLKPSQILVKLLIANNIGFTSQIKIPFLEDPIIGMFHEFISYRLNQRETKNALFIVSMNSYLKLIGSESRFKECDLNKLIGNEKLFGLYYSFCLLLDEMKLNVSLYKNNLQYIEKIIKSCTVNYEKILNKLTENDSLSYSTDFQYGQNANRINIMSAHASKGLEFHSVFLGGIYTNDKAMSKTPFLGKIPLSFKWKINLSDKQNLKTPFYLIESERQKYKEFSESKRLLYVAATRAQNALYWCDLDLSTYKASIGKNTWANALSVYDTNNSDFEISKNKISIKNHYHQSFLETIQFDKPLFHERSVGIELSNRDSSLIFLSELSVTRLAELVNCSYCFYLNQILKLDLEASSYEFEENEELSSRSFKSSAQRGTQIHEEISKLILGNFDLSNFSSEFDKPILWTVEKLKALGDNARFISEKQIKFPVFNFMISGIPDLIILNDKGDEAQIWDFKTGLISENESYWFQLNAYAHGVARLYNLKKPIKLVLCYVDEEKILERNCFQEDVDNYLWNYWKALKSPLDHKNSECKNCSSM